MTALSILDQAPLRVDGEPGHSLRDTLALAQDADALGFERYWLAEHHAMDCVAASAPEIVIGHVAAVTTHLRVGSGGVLLPNHRPLHVVEQFRTLEALHPGRIDLGIGRSEGALDDATVQALGRPGDTAHGAGFDHQLDELLGFGGVRPFPAEHALARVRAMPDDVPLPRVFLLGSGQASAATAASRGLGYAFAALINPAAAAAALRTYRESFVQTRPGDRPHAILAIRVYTADDEEQALAIAASGRLASARNRCGRPARLLPSANAREHKWDAEELAAGVRMHQEADVVGDPQQVHARLEALLTETQADELMVLTNTYDPAERRLVYRLLAEVFSLTPRAPAADAPAMVAGQ